MINIPVIFNVAVRSMLSCRDLLYKNKKVTLSQIETIFICQKIKLWNKNSVFFDGVFFMGTNIRLRALEQSDLRFIHELNNNRSIMAYWFEEPYESFFELEELFRKHIHDNTERRFIAENGEHQPVGLVELVEINTIHRNAEFQIIIAPKFQGYGYARILINKALNYAFTILNLHKVYLSVAVNNEKAIHLYEDCGFTEEGQLVEEIFVNGEYTDVKRMYILQRKYLAGRVKNV